MIMNQNQPIHPEECPDLSAINERVTAGIHAHERKMRALTCVAFLLGFLALAASVVIVSLYFVSYRPKEKEVLRQVTLAAAQTKANAAPAEGGPAPAPKLPFDFPSVQATMTFFHSVVITLLAGAVGLSAVGTLMLIALVVLSRRATLHQINASLARISTRLKELPPGKYPG